LRFRSDDAMASNDDGKMHNFSLNRADSHVETDFWNNWEIERLLATATIPARQLLRQATPRIFSCRRAADSANISTGAGRARSVPDLLPPAVALASGNYVRGGD